ncbi:MAG: hypothetical protein IH971_06255 [Candidatus Marinimicrobia bacterium]|nr:hypothetical protein [Candidatus Neomarinimicrobiota bacterium]
MVRRSYAAAGLIILSAPHIVLACATCFGAADDPIITGVKLAMLGLLGVTTTILIGIGAFMVHLARRSRTLESAPDPWRDISAGRVSDHRRVRDES